MKLFHAFAAVALAGGVGNAATAQSAGLTPATIGTTGDTACRNDRPYALLAMGTNGGESIEMVEADTRHMIARLQAAGYRVVVVPPRNHAWPGGDGRPLYRAVTNAARAMGVPVVRATRWEMPQGYHINMDEARAIGGRYPGASTFGDSNSVRLNAGTGGAGYGVIGAKTGAIAYEQPVPAAVSAYATQPGALRTPGCLKP